jgi:cephalosporin hydroxylase
MYPYSSLLQLPRPDVVIELGTNAGGGSVFFASILKLLGHGRVITIDPRHVSEGDW